MECLPRTLKLFSTDDAGENMKPFELLLRAFLLASSERASRDATIITLPEGIRYLEAYVGQQIEEMPIFVLPRSLTILAMWGLPSLEQFTEL